MRHPTNTFQARAIYRRLKTVLYVQWRGMVIVFNLLFDVIFFAVVFVYLDDYSANDEKNYERALPWLGCLLEHPNDKNACISLGEKWLVNEATVSAVLLLLALSGTEMFLLIFRWSIFTGWREWFADRFGRKQEFVSLDAIPAEQRPWTPNSSQDPNTKPSMFEMQRPTQNKDYGDVEARAVSPSATDMGSPVGSYTSHLNYGRRTPDATGGLGMPAYYATSEKDPDRPYRVASPTIGDKDPDKPYRTVQPQVQPSSLVQHHQQPAPVVQRTTSQGSKSMRQQQQQQQQSPYGLGMDMSGMGWDPRSTYAGRGGGAFANASPRESRAEYEGSPTLLQSQSPGGTSLRYR